MGPDAGFRLSRRVLRAVVGVLAMVARRPGKGRVVPITPSVAAAVVVLAFGAWPAAPAGANQPSSAGASPASAVDERPPGEEIIGLRTRRSRAYRSADGIASTRVYAGSVNYTDGAGAWQPIDNSLEPRW